MCNMSSAGKNENGLGPGQDDNEPSDEDIDYEEEEEDEDVGKIINVAFDARPPSDSDFHGIKRLLQQLFLKDINEELSELAHLITVQDTVGCVLKQDHGDDDSEDEDDDSDDSDDDQNIFAVNTVVNISENQSITCIEKVRQLLSRTCEENSKDDPVRMKKLLDDPSKQVGLLISERFINIPPQIALPSYESLKSDIERAVRKKKRFNFTHLALISKTYRGKEGELKSQMFYTNAEEELFKDISEFSYTFSVANQRDSLSDGQWDDDGGDFESLRTVMLFDASSLGHMIEKLRSEIPAT